MKATVFFTFELNKGNAEQTILDSFFSYKRQLKKYALKQKMLSQYIYRMSRDNSLFKEIYEFSKSHNKIQIDQIDLQTKIDQKDEETAIAYKIWFCRHVAQTYDDQEEDVQECSGCRSLMQIKPLYYIRPQGVMIKNTQKKPLIRDEMAHHYMIRSEEYIKLKNIVNVEKYFYPISSKRGKVIAYELVGENILSKEAYEDKNYMNKKLCRKCGNYNHKEIDVGMFLPLTIKKGTFVDYINYSEDYYYSQRDMIISKELYMAMKEINIEMDVIPIFEK